MRLVDKDNGTVFTFKTRDELAEFKYQRYMQRYLRTIQSIDDNTGRLLDYLDEEGLTENTIVIYTSDQGFFLGEHGWFDKVQHLDSIDNSDILTSANSVSCTRKAFRCLC